MATGGNGSDEIINFKCCICANKNITREAKNYCVECQDYYCTSCTDLHKLFPSAMGVHQFIDKTNFSTTGAQTFLSSFPTERCVAHKSKQLDMYCADHDEIVCTTCVALNHRTCTKLHSVPDELHCLYEKSAADETKELLLATKTKMEDVKKTKEHLVVELNKYKENAAESIKHFRKEMEDELYRLESESLRNLEETYMRMKNGLEDSIKVAQQYIDELQLSVDKIINSRGKNAQEFVCVKVAKRYIFETTETRKDLTKAVNVKIEFIVNPTIVILFNDLKTFGLVSEPAINNLKTTLYEVESKNQVNIIHTNDRSTCSIYGSCFTYDGLLLLADCNNKSLKRVDLWSKQVKDLVLEDSPFDVCQTSKNEIAVSLNNQSIQFVLLQNMMIATKQLKLNHICWGLAYTNGNLFVSDSNVSLYIYDINGSLQRKITTDQSGNTIFRANRHISVSSYGDRVYIADYYKGLVVVDLYGNYESTCTDPDLVSPWGVCTDGRGNILTCGWGSSNIVQVNERSSQKAGVIGKIHNGSSVCFNPKQNNLVVTCANSDTVEVYKVA